MPNFLRSTLVLSCVALLSTVLLASCRQPTQAPAAATPAPATRPAQALQLLTAHLRDNDLEAFARDAVPPALYARLDTAWHEGRTRWPLDELPFGQRLPALLKSLAAPGSEARLQRVFDRQFAHADGQIHGAATSLGLFGAQYVQNEGDYSDAERQHYTQLIAVISHWGTAAPLGDPQRAHAAIATLAAAARRSGLTSEAAFRTAGMEAGLRRMAPFAAAFKHSLRRYGLDLDADLGAMQTSLQQQTGDSARVRMRYVLAGQPIDTVVAMRRVDGRWYVADYLRHAEAAVARSLPAHGPLNRAVAGLRPARGRLGDNAEDADPADPTFSGPAAGPAVRAAATRAGRERRRGAG